MSFREADRKHRALNGNSKFCILLKFHGLELSTKEDDW